MTVRLLDINVLIALCWPSHVNHEDAHVWFLNNANKGWATCPITQNGFVRISSNPAIIEDAVSPGEALEVLKGLVSHKKHIFLADDIALYDTQYILFEHIMGHRQITDSYLIGLALKHKGILVTFDKNLKSTLPQESDQFKTVELISISLQKD